MRPPARTPNSDPSLMGQPRPGWQAVRPSSNTIENKYIWVTVCLLKDSVFGSLRLFFFLSSLWALPLDLKFCFLPLGNGEIAIQCQCHLLIVCVWEKERNIYLFILGLTVRGWKKPKFDIASFASTTCVAILSICLLGWSSGTAKQLLTHTCLFLNN